MYTTKACPTRQQQQHSQPCIGTSNAIHLASQKAHLKACKLEFAILEASPQELLPPRQVHALPDCFHGVRGGVIIIVCVSTCSIGNLQSRLHSTGQTVTWCMADRAHFCVEVMQLHGCMYHFWMLPGKCSGSGQQYTAIMAAATANSRACGAQSAACLSA